VPFTEEEDEIITQSVLDDMKSNSTDKRGIGFWESTSKKIPNRSPVHINNRWHKVLLIDERVILQLKEINNNKKKSE
jgi:hypothetical protein